MKTYYQIYASFSLSHGKPQLVGISLNSTGVYFPFLVGSYAYTLSYSRFFRTIPQAQEYVNYLFSRYPESPAARPVLDGGQPLLF